MRLARIITNRRWPAISAPAGFGKTTLVSEWIAEEERPWSEAHLIGRHVDH